MTPGTAYVHRSPSTTETTRRGLDLSISEPSTRGDEVQVLSAASCCTCIRIHAAGDLGYRPRFGPGSLVAADCEEGLESSRGRWRPQPRGRKLHLPYVSGVSTERHQSPPCNTKCVRRRSESRTASHPAVRQVARKPPGRLRRHRGEWQPNRSARHKDDIVVSSRSTWTEAEGAPAICVARPLRQISTEKSACARDRQEQIAARQRQEFLGGVEGNLLGNTKRQRNRGRCGLQCRPMIDDEFANGSVAPGQRLIAVTVGEQLPEAVRRLRTALLS